MRVRKAFLASVAAVIFAPSAAIAGMVSDPVPERFGWGGFYAGVHGAVAAGTNIYGAGLSGAPPLLTLDGTASGGLYGAQIGYDWQMGRFVVGAIADIALSNYRANLSLGAGPVGLAVGTGLDYLATVRMRGGYTFDRALFYAHGGLAYQGRAGWAAGAGIEYALTNRLSIGTEYAYVDLGSRDLFNNGVVQATETLKLHTVKALMNYRFGSARASATGPDMSSDSTSKWTGWSGFYAGVHGGIAAGNTTYGIAPSGFPPLLTLGMTASGGLLGGQIGYDWQGGRFVVGGVADIAWSAYRANLALGSGPFGVSAGSRLNYLGTVRVRGGYAFDRALVYGHGGFAYGSTTQTITALGATVLTATQGRTGWTVGAGVEYALTNCISLGTEYAYVNLGTRDLFSGGAVQLTESVSLHMLKALVNYRF